MAARAAEAATRDDTHHVPGLLRPARWHNLTHVDFGKTAGQSGLWRRSSSRRRRGGPNSASAHRGQ
jgi:hypothetical protein